MGEGQESPPEDVESGATISGGTTGSQPSEKGSPEDAASETSHEDISDTAGEPPTEPSPEAEPTQPGEE